MRNLITGMVVAVTFALVAAGCARKATTEAAPSVTEATAAAVAPTASAAQSPAASPTETASGASMAPSASPTIEVVFTDVSGTFAEPAIKDEAALGVFDPSTGAFKPNDPIKRREFVRWLFKANNAYFKDDQSQQIRPAESGPATFVDVPTTDPDFRYIQGVANMGIVIGIDKTHFQPDRPLTREEMVAIKTGRDASDSWKTRTGFGDLKYVLPVTDVGKISKSYWDAIYSDYFNSSYNIKRVFGPIKTFFPTKPLTRAEAAIALQSIGNFKRMTAEKALGKNQE